MEQMELFSRPEFSINKKIMLIENFGGIGCQAMALEHLGVDFDSNLIEFDKYPVASYNAIHGTSFEPKDIRNIHAEDWNITEKDKYCYIVTYSFPCTDLSLAGERKGMSKKDWLEGKSTRSGLLWEVERIINECHALVEKDPEHYGMPDVLVMENVTQVHSNKQLEDWNAWLFTLSQLGYSNYYQDCNAKNFGVAQNRDRTFMVSILGDYNFEFPKEIPLTHVMKDYLDENVPEKYYINTDRANQLIDNLIERKVLPDAE